MLLCFAYPSSGPTVIYLILISRELWNGHIELNCFCAVLPRFKKWIYKCPNLCLFLYFKSIQVQSFALFDISIELNILSKLLLLLITCILRNYFFRALYNKDIPKNAFRTSNGTPEAHFLLFQVQYKGSSTIFLKERGEKSQTQLLEIWVNVLKCVADQVFLEQQLSVQSPWRADTGILMCRWCSQAGSRHQLLLSSPFCHCPEPLCSPQLFWAEPREMRYSIKPPIKEDVGFFFFPCGREIVY